MILTVAEKRTMEIKQNKTKSDAQTLRQMNDQPPAMNNSCYRLVCCDFRSGITGGERERD